MKKVLLFALLITIVLLAAACNTTPTQPPPPPAAPPPPPPVRQEYNRHSSGIILDGAVYYTVKSGDSLSKISAEVYGNQSYYPLIMMVADDVKDIDLIHPNMRLLIPVLNTNLEDPQAKDSINRYFNEIAQLEERRGRRTMAANIRDLTR